MWALKILLIPLLLYVALVASIYFGQTSLIFPARLVPPAGPLPAGAERLEVAGADQERLLGVHIAPRQAGQGPVILGFAGNAWNAEQGASFLREIYPTADVVTFHYRGYRPSGGRASAAALLADAPLIHDAVAARFPGQPIVAVGFSIGSGVAAHLARQRPLAGVILVTPFDSLAEVGHDHYPWLPVRLLLRHRMEPAEDLRESEVPAALIIAGQDRLIPPIRGKLLASRVRNLAYQRVIDNAGHNDVYGNPEFAGAMAEALKRLMDAEDGRQR